MNLCPRNEALNTNKGAAGKRFCIIFCRKLLQHRQSCRWPSYPSRAAVLVLSLSLQTCKFVSHSRGVQFHILWHRPRSLLSDRCQINDKPIESSTRYMCSIHYRSIIRVPFSTKLLYGNPAFVFPPMQYKTVFVGFAKTQFRLPSWWSLIPTGRLSTTILSSSEHPLRCLAWVATLAGYNRKTVPFDHSRRVVP